MAATRHNLSRRAVLGAGVGACAVPLAGAAAAATRQAQLAVRGTLIGGGATAPAAAPSSKKRTPSPSYVRLSVAISSGLMSRCSFSKRRRVRLLMPAAADAASIGQSSAARAMRDCVGVIVLALRADPLDACLRGRYL